MYEHYERHRSDNITDPAVRRTHPISTISGWERDQDQSSENSTKNGPSLNDKAITANDTQNVPEKLYKISKSEQTDDDVVDIENVNCICDDNSSQDDANLSNNIDTTKEQTAQVLNSTEINKPVQSISSISQVYNEQLTGQSIVCNGDTEHEFNDDDTMNTPTVNASGVDSNTSGSDALRKTLEIDSYDMSEDNKEIVDEIVEEILTKSENLLDDCKRTLDETETTSSPVIKDEEIEHAVSEVVKGVRNIERKVKRDSETEPENHIIDANIKRDAENIDIESTILASNELSEVQNENQKTELVLSNAVNNETKDILNDVIDNENNLEEKNATVNTETDEIKDIVATIVNDVIENCVNQTATDIGDVCDNDMNKMSIIDNINNNSTDVTTNDSNDNAIIVDTITQTTEIVSTLNAPINETTTPIAITAVEETNEEIIKGIVNEIVDKCVESETNTATDNDNNNNNHSDEDASLNKTGGEAFNSGTMNKTTNGEPLNSADSAKFTSTPEAIDEDNADDTNSTDDNRNAKLNRSTSISTSTQVENNHFGNSQINEIF